MNSNISNGVKVSGYIRPIGLSDSYPTHLDTYGRGGIHSVLNEQVRNDITTERRSLGMFAFDQSANSMYCLLGGVSNENWFKLFEFKNNKIDFTLPCDNDYILVGNKDGIATPSPRLIDIKYDIIDLRREVDGLGALEKLDHNRIWIGDYTNKPLAKTNILLQNMPQIGAALFPEPTGSLNIPLPNPTFNPFSGLDWLMSGAWLPQIFAGSPGKLDPTSKDTILSSSLAMTQIKTAQAIRRLDNASFIVKNRTLDFTWENPAMLLIPDAVKRFYDLETSYRFTEAQALDEIGEGILYTDDSGNLSKATLSNNHMWLGQRVGEEDNVPTEVEHLLIDNLPELGVTVVPKPDKTNVGKVWLGTESGRPEESSLVGEMFADITALNAKFLAGNFIMNSGLTGSFPKAQFLNTLSSGLLKNTTGTGMLSIANGGKNPITDDYVRPIDLQEEIEAAIATADAASIAYFTAQMAPYSLIPAPSTAGLAISGAFVAVEAQVANKESKSDHDADIAAVNTKIDDLGITLQGEAYGSGKLSETIDTKVAFQFFKKQELPTDPHLGRLLFVER